MSELIVREQRLRTFDNLPPVAPRHSFAADDLPVASPTVMAAAHTVERLAARHSRRRVAHDQPGHDGLALG